MEIFLLIIAGFSLLIAFNLFRKNEKLEEIVISQQKHIDEIYSQITDSAAKLKIIDERGTFESDDEVGWFFESIKDIQNKLNTLLK
jgi:HAMP domain-containing protein